MRNPRIKLTDHTAVSDAELVDRFGTLWAERFKNVLVEGNSEALRTVAADIDLNPVRGWLVQDPRDYRYSGYGEAPDGSGEARAGLLAVESARPIGSAKRPNTGCVCMSRAARRGNRARRCLTGRRSCRCGTGRVYSLPFAGRLELAA